MVLGSFALLAGVEPGEVSDWFLEMYVDAFDWVVTPNVIGMSQFATGGTLTSKPCVSGGAYLDRMGDHCGLCPNDPRLSTGPDACPFTTLHWDFVDHHAERFEANPRMATIVAAWRRRDAPRAPRSGPGPRRSGRWPTPEPSEQERRRA
jgi:deoxyribodipyrimidine photolyase-related protein